MTDENHTDAPATPGEPTAAPAAPPTTPPEPTTPPGAPEPAAPPVPAPTAPLGASAPEPTTPPGVPAPEDPRAWLEDVEGEEQLAWVRERNAESAASLESTGRFAAIESEILEVLTSQDKIPAVSQRGEHLYNFWTDADHERGLWRRTTWDSYRTDSPKWEILLDLDALSQEDGVQWVWHGATHLAPDYSRALVSLSRGGSDADITREFDLVAKRFVEGGFAREEAKGALDWTTNAPDEVFAYTDFGPGSMTTSGYPRTVRRWRRGTPLEDAEILYEGLESDMYIGAGADRTPGFEREFVQRTLAFYDEETYEIRGGELALIDVPRSANTGVWREWLLVHLREPWDVAGSHFPGGALIAAKYEAFMAGARDFTVLFSPTARTSLAAVTQTRHHVVLTLLNDVVNSLELLTPTDRADAGADDDGGWHRRHLDLEGTEVPHLGTIAAGPVDATESDDLWLTTAGYLDPTTLSVLRLNAAGETASFEALKSLPAFFEVAGTHVEQHFVTSADGTRIPYFQVTPAHAADGPAPTLLYGYGGFEIPLLPGYSPAMGRAWLTRGGVYVVANIRGGGEYGPAWHQAALKEKRHTAYEDFAAVARDLVARGVTTPAQLGAQGGSNGGLLMGNMYTQYPELFGAIVCQVPLLDMKRYSHLLAGASWMAEYGDPDDDAQWAYIRTFSPYHLVREGVEYPPILFTTSTRDDRVHPGHARKMAALMLEEGADVTYYENIEGGHGGAATDAQRAHMQALAFEFLWQHLA